MSEPPDVVALILAAGRGKRFGESNKLLAELEGRPLLRRVAESALASKARHTIVVTGHDSATVAAALADLPVSFAENPDYESGLASSLKAGLAATAGHGVIVYLGDMPGVSTAVLDALIAAFEASPGCAAVVPVCRGRRGNPVLLSRRIFPQLAALQGDEGARRLLGSMEDVVEIAVDEEGVLADVDTPADLAAFRRS